MIGRVGLVLVGALVAAPASARAQDGRVELSAGAGRWGAAALGVREASLTAGDLSAFRLFSTETELEAATLVTAAAAVRISGLFDVEARGTYGRPVLTARITNDAEGVPAVDASERVQEFAVAVLAVIHPEAWRLGWRAAFFVAGGAGYLRHLHEGGSFAESGRVYLAGGGLKYRLTRGPGLLAVGLRINADVAVREGLSALSGRTPASPLVSASLFVRF